MLIVSLGAYGCTLNCDKTTSSIKENVVRNAGLHLRERQVSWSKLVPCEFDSLKVYGTNFIADNDDKLKMCGVNKIPGWKYGYDAIVCFKEGAIVYFELFEQEISEENSTGQSWDVFLNIDDYESYDYLPLDKVTLENRPFKKTELLIYGDTLENAAK